MNKAFIFDWSGTLNDNFHLFCKVCDLIFTEVGRDLISPDEIRAHMTLPYMKFWNHYCPDLPKEKQDLLYLKYIHEVGESELHPNVGIILSYLHEQGYQLFVVSSDPASKLLPDIEKSGFSHLFTKAISDTYDKQDNLSALINEFSLDQNQTFYVGDTSGDVEAGKIAGVKTIGITWGFQNRDLLSRAEPDYLIDDIVEIKSLF